MDQFTFSENAGNVIKEEAKPRALRKPRSAYFEMISEAISLLKERIGSSQIAIAKFIKDKHKTKLSANFRKLLRVQLKKLTTSCKLNKVKASYKLPPAPPHPAAASASPAKPAAKKPAAKAKAPAARPKAKAKAKAKAAAAKPKAKPAASKPKVKPNAAAAAAKPKAVAAKPKAAAAKPKTVAKPKPKAACKAQGEGQAGEGRDDECEGHSIEEDCREGQGQAGDRA